MPKLRPTDDAFEKIGATLTAEMPTTTSGIIASNFSLTEWSRKASFAGDDALRVALGQLAKTRGLPDVMGQFDAATSLIRRPLEQRTFAMGTMPVDVFSDVDVRDFMAGDLQGALAEAVGRELGELAGNAVGDLAGGFIGAVPVVGGIVRGFYDVIRGMVAYRAKVPEYENAFPQADPTADRNKADQVIEVARNRPRGDWGPLFMPPGRAVDAHWAAGMGELDLPGNWWAVGKVDFWDPTKPDQSFYPNPSYGMGVLGDMWLRGRSFAGCPRLNDGGDVTVPIHLGVVTSTEAGAKAFDAGRFLPTTQQALQHLYMLLRNPASPYVMNVWAERMAEFWLRYMAAFRIGLHSTYFGGTDRTAPTRHILVKWQDLKAGTTTPAPSNLRRQARIRACDAMAEVFGWPKWGRADEELLGKPLGIDGTADAFRLRETPVFRAWHDLHKRQLYACRSATVAYFDGTESGFGSSDMRDARRETLEELTTSRASLFVDVSMVPDPELRRSLEAIQTGGKDPNALAQGEQTRKREQRRGATLADLRVKPGSLLPPIRFTIATLGNVQGGSSPPKVPPLPTLRPVKAAKISPIPEITPAELGDEDDGGSSAGPAAAAVGGGIGIALLLAALL